MYKMMVSSFYNTLINKDEAIALDTMLNIDRIRNKGILFVVSTAALFRTIIDYNDSLIFTYNSSNGSEEDKQKIFEVGEVSSKNCTNDYPYAMALKRCMDRVILKNSQLAYNGVYSDSEAEEFSNNEDESTKEETKVIPATEKQLELIKNIFKDKKLELKNILAVIGKKKIDELTVQEASKIISENKEN